MSRLKHLFAMLCVLLGTIVLSIPLWAEADNKNALAKAHVNELEAPLYSPFVERYVLDELKQLRSEQATIRVEFNEKILEREHQSIDRAVTYATDTVTYFFYLIAAASSILVIVGWTSIRDIKDRVHTYANDQVSKIVDEYENRLSNIEKQLTQKAQHIEENREEIELTQDVQSLWLRAQQDSSPSGKIEIYDDILRRRPEDCEALTYKADAALELGEPQWAVNLCLQALKIDPENSHAFYQLAGAYTALDRYDEAIVNLKKALSFRESYREDIQEDPAFHALYGHTGFRGLMQGEHIN